MVFIDLPHNGQTSFGLQTCCETVRMVVCEWNFHWIHQSSPRTLTTEMLLNRICNHRMVTYKATLSLMKHLTCLKPWQVLQVILPSLLHGTQLETQRKELFKLVCEGRGAGHVASGCGHTWTSSFYICCTAEYNQNSTATRMQMTVCKLKN